MFATRRSNFLFLFLFLFSPLVFWVSQASFLLTTFKYLSVILLSATFSESAHHLQTSTIVGYLLISLDGLFMASSAFSLIAVVIVLNQHIRKAEKRQAELDAKTIKKKKKKKKKSKDTEEDVVAAAEIQSDPKQEEGESKEAAPAKKLTKKQIRRIKLKKEREEKAIEDEKKRLEEEEAERIAAALAAEAANEEDEGEQKGVDQVDFQPEYQKQEKKKKKKKPRQGKSNFTKKPNPVGF